MNDTYSYHAPAEVFRRRVDPTWVRIGVLAFALAATIGAFARVVVTSERASDVRWAAARAAAAEPAPAPPPVEAIGDDAAAKAAVASALGVARDIVEGGGSFRDATTAALADEVPDLVFVDGPSGAPTIVSVEARRTAWAAAVMGQGGVCFWVKVTAPGAIRYATADACTGADAMAASEASW